VTPNRQSAVTNSRPEAENLGQRAGYLARATGGNGHVLIVGAGIGGLACALALARRGFTSTIFERAPRLSEIGAGMQISPNASRILFELGLGEAVASYAVAPEALLVRSGQSGRVLQRLELGATAEERYGSPYWVIHRADLQHVMAEAIANEPACELMLGTHLKSFESNSQDVAVTVNSGKVHRGSVLVGADGMRSAVRRGMFNDGDPEFSGYTAWRGTISADAMPEELDSRCSGLWLGPDAHLVHYPLRGGEVVNVVAVVSSEELAPDWGESCDLGALDPYYSDWVAPARDMIAGVGQWLRWPLYDRGPAQHWSRGRVTLLGDAAHPALPFIAQGGAIALEDAAVLARQLHAAPADPARALAAYEEDRLPRTSRLQRQARRNGRIFHMATAVSLLRDLRLRTMGADAFARRQDWIYSWNPDA
jgi:salicylate hydroxylase